MDTRTTSSLFLHASRLHAAQLHSRRTSTWLILVVASLVALLIGGCATDPAGGTEAAPLLSSPWIESPPPGIELFLDAERASQMGGQVIALAATAEAARAEADTSVGESAEAEDGSIDTEEAEATESRVAEAPSDEAGANEEGTDGEVSGDGSGEQAAAQSEDRSAAEPPSVVISNRSVNIRSGPGLNFSVVAGARAGAEFEALGRSEDEGWWRICCVQGPNDSGDEATLRAWVSDVVVTPNEAALAQPIYTPLFPEDLQAVWTVDYECGSERCEVKTCDGTITASLRGDGDAQWLEIDRTVTWHDGCGEDSTWLHQVDRLEGAERYGDGSDLFLFHFWAGRNPGPVNSLFSLSEEKQVKTWCSEEQEVELEEGGGWTTIYEGMTCHDVRTGMLVSMKYTKRWLFTGEFEGEEYEEAYFGDFEIYEVKLDDTNVELAWVNPSQSGDDQANAGE